MKFFYDDDEPRGEFNPGVRINPTRQYIKHYENQMFLQLVLMNGQRLEKYQARKEMAICERKLLYWQNRPGFDQDDATQACNEIKKRWKEGK